MQYFGKPMQSREALIYISWRWWLDGSGDELGSNGVLEQGKTGWARSRLPFDTFFTPKNLLIIIALNMIM